MRKFIDLVGLSEAPLADLARELDPYVASTDGQDTRFTDADRRYISREKYPAIVAKKLERVPFDLYVYIRDSAKTRDIGMVSDAESGKGRYSFFYYLHDSDEIEELKKVVGDETVAGIMKNSNAVHLLITHNDPYSDDWQALTPWMILHRLAHACLDDGQRNHKESPIVQHIRKELSRFEEQIAHITRKHPYDILRKIFPFKSAQLPSGKYELWMDVFVSYCYSGGVLRTNPSDDPALEAAINQLKINLKALFDRLIQSLHSCVWVG